MAGKSKLKDIPMLPTRYWDVVNQKVCENGTLSHVEYVGQVDYKNGVTIQPTLFPNVPFPDVLTFTGFSRGRSAAGAKFTNAAGQNFYMFLTDFTPVVPLLEKGELTGVFKYVKRGTSFGVQLQ